MVTALPKHKLFRGKLETNGIRNHTHGHGTHNPQTNPNDLNYKLGLRATIIRTKFHATYVL